MTDINDLDPLLPIAQVALGAGLVAVIAGVALIIYDMWRNGR